MNELLSSAATLGLPLLAAAVAAMGSETAHAAGVDPAMTMVTPPDKIPWGRSKISRPAWPGRAMFGKLSEPGQYFVLIRWHPGYMSAPHDYETDPVCVVLSGPGGLRAATILSPRRPCRCGRSFVRRVGGTPHYDGVTKSDTEPAIIAITGIGPIHYNLSDPNKPGGREV